MHILILGNGFDLAHGLKTKYSDFLNYCIDKNKERISPVVNYGFTFVDNIWLRHFITVFHRLGHNWIDLEQEIYNVIKNLNKSIFDLANGEIDKIFPLNFVLLKNNLEFYFNEIGIYLHSDGYRVEVNSKNYSLVETDDFTSLYFYIKNYDGFVNFIYDQLREFTVLFEKYLVEEVEFKLDENSKYFLSLNTIGIKKNDNDVHILSFNYTNICEKLYKKKFNAYCNIDKIHPVYVHGKANETGLCSLVLGTSTFDDLPSKYNLFKKHNQRHKYATIEAYQELLRKLIDTKTIPYFHIIGHSLDKSDHNILNHILLANKKSIINVYYHDEETQERLINNITDIIGEEEVMSKVRFIHLHNDERSILKPKVESVVTK